MCMWIFDIFRKSVGKVGTVNETPIKDDST